MYEVPRESEEYIYPEFRVNGELTIEGVQFSVVPATQRPEVWVDAVVREGKTGYFITGMQPGSYRVFSRVTTDPPQRPVEDDVYFRIT